MIRRFYVWLRERQPWLAKLLYRLYRQRLLRLGRPRGLTIRGDLSAVRNIRFDVQGRGHVLELGAWTTVDDFRLILRGSNHRVVLGDDVHIRSGVLCMEDDGGLLEIGRGSTFEGVAIGMVEPASRVRIGEDCMFSYDIDLRCSDSHAIYDQESGQRINPPAPVEIGDHVWVGTRATLLKGTRLAAGSIVAAGATVTGAFEQPGVIVGGMPARVLRQGVRWTRERG